MYKRQPTNGVFPFKVVLPVLTHIVCDTPAFAIVGTSSVWMLIVDVELAQTPFAMLHCNIVVPTAVSYTHLTNTPCCRLN